MVHFNTIIPKGQGAPAPFGRKTKKIFGIYRLSIVFSAILFYDCPIKAFIH